MISDFLSKNELLKKLLKVNKNLLVLVCLIFFCGLLLLYSASKGNIKPWALRQFVYFVLFLPVCIAISIINIQFWFRHSYIIYCCGLFLLILVEIVGYKSMGATRWINLGFMRIQPSEIMKVCFILAMARYFFQCGPSDPQKNMKLIKPLLLFLVPFILILKQPNLGTALILVAIMISILFLVGVQIWKFILCFTIGLCCIPVVWKYGLHDYQQRRVLIFLKPESDPLKSGYNITQSKIAIGSGGIWGRGFLDGTQGQLEFLPEKHTDFIFTILSEEFGFIGSLSVIIMYLILFIFLLYIITKCKHSYGKIIVGGIFTNLFCHFFINIGMVTGILPVVGTPLPLLSYGGSITASTLISIGFILNVDIHRDYEI
ncbi:MAG: rod shape-determining protein RodA [Rickettsiales bacterium]|jgi:rod shape determining protein RodA|nr:rod shape-determining protein RodA [Rickettsiales bacterium]